MNIKEKRVELRSSKFTTSNDSLQMGADFVSAFAMGFDIDDAIALLRLDSLYIQSFDIKDVRQTLGQDALGRAIGRIAGKDGVCRFFGLYAFALAEAEGCFVVVWKMC
jgi:RNA-binding protein PNO1